MHDSQAPPSPLSALLRTIPPSRVYGLADKATLDAAFIALAKGPVDDVETTDGGARVAFEFGREITTIYSEGNDLRFRCTCDDSGKGGRCPHLVAALVTLKKITDPTAFPLVKMSQATRDFLAGRLGPGFAPGPPGSPGNPRTHGRVLPEEAPRNKTSAAVTTPRDTGVVTVVIERHSDGRSDLWLRRGAIRLNGGYGQGIPYRLATLANRSFSRENRCTSLRQNLSPGGGTRAPIVYLDGSREVPLTLCDGARYRTRTFLSIGKGKATIRHGLEGEKGEDGPWMIGGGLAIDLAAGTIFLSPDDDGLKSWRLFRNAATAGNPFPPDDPPFGGGIFSFPADGFRELPVCVPAYFVERFRKSVQVRIGGRNAPAVCVLPEVSPGGVPTVSDRMNGILEGIPGGPQFVALTAERTVDGTSLPFDPSPFVIFDPARLPSHLRGKKRRAALYRAFFLAIEESDPERRVALIARELIPVLGKGHDPKGNVRFLLAIADACREETFRFVLPERGFPVLVPGGRLRQALMLRLPFERFGPEIFDGLGEIGEMCVEPESFINGLPAFNAALAGHGIDLRYKGKPLPVVSWDIRIDASRPEIDWFEIRPEIRWNGNPIGEETWRQVAEGTGCIRTEDGFHLIDPDTLAALRILGGIGTKEGGSKGKSRAPREIVRIPRLRILELMMMRCKGIDLTLPEEDERIFRRLMEFERIEAREAPLLLDARLRPYQLEGYSWLSFLYENRFGACLADDMGLGKTVQALTLLAALKEGRLDAGVPEGVPHLVVVPPSLLFNWENEIARFFPDARVRTYRGKGRSVDFNGVDIVLTSYDIVRRDIGRLEEIFFHVIVFDEAQAIKNLHASATGAARRLQGRFKLALTGTPLENHAGEFFSIMDLALPGLLGDYDDVRSRLRKEDPEAILTLKRRSRPFLLRRTKDAILKELPPKVETDVYLELTDRQRALYNRTAEEVRKTMEEAWAGRTEQQARIVALAALMKLRRVCLSADLVAPGVGEGEISPKIAFLVERLMELGEAGNRALVFSQFTSFLDLVEPALRGAGIEYLRLDGSTPVAERKALVEGFQARETPVHFLLSMKAGGKGLNLTKASYVFHLDPWWNPAVEDQASDRAHRIGQTSRVTVMRLLMRHTLEEKMMLLKARKRRLFQALVGDERTAGAAAISRADFDYLLETTDRKD
jgi:superfamily II DNA or RNA helicase